MEWYYCAAIALLGTLLIGGASFAIAALYSVVTKAHRLMREFDIDEKRAVALVRLEYDGQHGRLPYYALCVARNQTQSREQFIEVRDNMLAAYERKMFWNDAIMNYWTGDDPVLDPKPEWYNNQRSHATQ